MVTVPYSYPEASGVFTDIVRSCFREVTDVGSVWHNHCNGLTCCRAIFGIITVTD
jgi:hypothetical protein